VKTENSNELNIKELADILRCNRYLEFECENLYYQISESAELGYVVNVYSSNQKDENGDYLDCYLIDGGLCTGSAKDAIELLL
jgi:hypothetical protein